MKRAHSIRFALLLSLAACGGGKSGTPAGPSTTPPPAARANLSISLTVTGSRNGPGFIYAVRLTAQNTGSAAATISSLSLTVSAGTASGTATVAPADAFSSLSIAAGATATSALMNLHDDEGTAGYANKVSAAVGYSDSVGTNTATTSADVSALPAPPPTPPAVTITGTATESGAGVVSGVNIEIRDGPDARKFTTTDSAGRYTLPGLQPGTVTVRAWKTGYNDTDQRVTLAGASVTINFTIPKSGGGPPPPPPFPSDACPASPAPPAGATARCNNGQWSMSQNRSGTCSQNSGVACWVCPGVLCFPFAPDAGSGDQSAAPIHLRITIGGR